MPTTDGVVCVISCDKHDMWQASQKVSRPIPPRFKILVGSGHGFLAACALVARQNVPVQGTLHSEVVAALLKTTFYFTIPDSRQLGY